MKNSLGLDWALLLAGDFGWRVVPGMYNKKTERKHPVIGKAWQNQATNEIEQIKRWWAVKDWAWPGLVGGQGSCFVVDCDGQNAVNWFREQRLWAFCNPLIYTTPGRGGGLHCIWSWPSNVRSSELISCYIHPGVQIRGFNRFTLFYGAPRPDGKYYWKSGGDCKPGPPPQILVDLALENYKKLGDAGGYGSGEIGPIESLWHAQKRGIQHKDDELAIGRKRGFAGVIWYHLASGGDEEEIWEIAYRYSNELCDPPLEEEWISYTVNYALSRWEATNKNKDIVLGTQDQTYKWVRNMLQNWGDND